MEARSLSSLNFLAANPPQYPNKPNEVKQDALTLYILRVPGTRDVFLSPYKPQIKSVTAEDIESSLYYVHLRDPAEVDLDRHSQEYSRERSSSQPSIARKPVPSTGRPLTPDSPPKAPQLSLAAPATTKEVPPPRPGPVGGHQQTRGSPLSQITVPARPASPSDLARVPARKPLGPRPMTSSPTEGSKLEQHLVSKPRHTPTGSIAPQDRSSTDQGNGTGLSSTLDVQAVLFSLDLIRRDRSSGGQWNVARITCQGTEVSGIPQSPTWRRSPSPSKQCAPPAIDISIQNSGYAKFRNIPPPSVVEAGPAAIMSALAERHSGRSSDHSSNFSLPLAGDVNAASGDSSNGGYFSRQVTMGYTKSWTANVKEKLQKIEAEARARTGHRRGDSIFSMDTPERKAPPSETGTEGMRARGYAFNSPWNSRCEFRTGNAGRTLRLTHLLDHGSGNGSPSSEMELISELRFNLPTSEAMPGASMPRDSNLLKDFGNALRSRARSDPYRSEGEVDDDDDKPWPRFDLSLGKERAGGGRRGNRAKMGKLIITNEGLKMLDLVVAANIGVWWETWEKSF